MSSKHQHQISTELKITAWISHLATFEAQSCQVLLVLVAPHRVWHRVYLTSHLPLSGHQCHGDDDEEEDHKVYLPSHLPLSGHQCHHHLHSSYSSFQTLPFSPLHIQIYHKSQSTFFLILKPRCAHVLDHQRRSLAFQIVLIPGCKKGPKVVNSDSLCSEKCDR